MPALSGVAILEIPISQKLMPVYTPPRQSKRGTAANAELSAGNRMSRDFSPLLNVQKQPGHEAFFFCVVSPKLRAARWRL